MFPQKIIAATPVSTVPAKMLISPFSNVIVLVVLVVLVEALNTFRIRGRRLPLVVPSTWPSRISGGSMSAETPKATNMGLSENRVYSQ